MAEQGAAQTLAAWAKPPEIVEEKEPFRQPMSEAAKAMWDAAVTMKREAAAAVKAANEAFDLLVRQAMVHDKLPPMNNVGRDGDDWIEAKPPRR